MERKLKSLVSKREQAFSFWKIGVSLYPNRIFWNDKFAGFQKGLISHFRAGFSSCTIGGNDEFE